MMNIKLKQVDIEVLLNRKLNASITVEAALSFTLSIFIIFMMLGPLLIIKTSSDLLIDLNDMSKKRCNYEMIKSKVRDEKIFEDISEKINDNDILKSNINIAERVFSYISFLSRYNDRYDEKDRAYKSIDFVYDKTNGNYDEQTGLVKFDYVIDFNLPYNVLHVENVNSRFVIQRRAFIGIDGNRFENRDELREYIYLADNYLNSHIYHDDISCTYLVKHTYTYQYDEVLHQKNESGEFYTKCDYCFRDITINSRTTCYTTLYGDRFHYRENCPLMTAYVTRVPRDYIERYGLTLCSKCARRSNDD